MEEGQDKDPQSLLCWKAALIAKSIVAYGPLSAEKGEPVVKAAENEDDPVSSKELGHNERNRLEYGGDFSNQPLRDELLGHFFQFFQHFKTCLSLEGFESATATAISDRLQPVLRHSHSFLWESREGLAVSRLISNSYKACKHTG